MYDYHAKEEARYKTRMLACTRCGTHQETKDMQLKISVGFRAIHCKNCGKQERVQRNRCCCDAIWHQCPIHRIDPPYHTSRKGGKRNEHGAETAGKKVRLQNSNRQAPDIADSAPAATKAQLKRKGSQSKTGSEEAKANHEMRERVRDKQAKR